MPAVANRPTKPKASSVTTAGYTKWRKCGIQQGAEHCVAATRVEPTWRTKHFAPNSKSKRACLVLGLLPSGADLLSGLCQNLSHVHIRLRLALLSCANR